MACLKYTITNTGSTIVNFNYRRCDDSLWEYQVELLPNQTKNVWVLDDTYSTAFYNNIEVVGTESWPPPPPIPCVTGEPLTDANIIDAVALWFSNQSAAEAIYGGIECWNTTAVTDMTGLFGGATSFNEDIRDWDVSNVIFFSAMFAGASSFNQDISSWDVSSSINMYSMFAEATSFNQNIGSWNVSGVTSMYAMFELATSFNQDISSWDTTNLIQIFSMFAGATSFNNGGVALSWTNTGNILDLHSIFEGATSFNQDVSSWDVSNVTNMENMFRDATSFNNGGVALDWADTREVRSTNGMFTRATSFNQDISNWLINNISVDMGSMFREATSFNQSLNNWEMDGINSMDYMFYGATSFNNGGVTPTWVNLSNVENLFSMFYSATSFNQNIGSWYITSVIDAITMFGETGQPSAVTLSTANYDALLSGWSLLTLQPDVTFSAGNSKYTDSAARLILTSAPNNWTITDGGPA